MKPPCLLVLRSHSRVRLHGERSKQAFPTCLPETSWMFVCCWGHAVLTDRISSRQWLSALHVASLRVSALTQLFLVACQTCPKDLIQAALNHFLKETTLRGEPSGTLIIKCDSLQNDKSDLREPRAIVVKALISPILFSVSNFSP